jgi:hypothetical protein
MADSWQVVFDGGHQQRYFPSREAAVRWLLAVGPRAASGVFEVFAEAAPDGEVPGRVFRLAEVIDLRRPGTIDALREELLCEP